MSSEFMPSSVGLALMPTSYANFIKISPGAFIAGLIVPREGGLAIMITEKLEDMVSIIFLPLVGYSL